MWKAPELQRTFNSSSFSINYLYPSSSQQQPTILAFQKGDVFSYAVIVQEILYRKGVYYLTDEDKQRFKLDAKDERDNSATSYKGFIFIKLSN